MADNKIKFGLKNVHYAMLTDESTPTYDAPVSIPGAIELSVDPDGDLMKLFADNIAYATAASNNGYNGTLNMALIPAAVKEDWFGWKIDDDGGLIEIADAQPAPFALMYEIDGDEHAARNVFYKCVAARAKQDNKTKADKLTATTDEVTLIISPLDIDDRIVVQKSIERSNANASVYDAWYTDVALPSFSVS